ncbi:kinetochore Sim4 complex subunit FTA2-domain-containing protein [Xylaria flabelliformis]|nr:kinetochore Sim4 complex subunit FTA2-domain-containing protein [Xylaria flabelliformis]
MYPDWPKCATDLGPLPECPGPKLGPFDFQGPQKIRFLGILGEGLHAIVFKVEMLGQIYALKVFRWIYDYNWLGYGEFINRENPEGLSTIYNYMEPFNAECRAFGRLQETGCEELAVRCFGYVLLDKDHEHAMMTQFNLNKWSFNGDIDESGYIDEEEQRMLYPGKSGRPPPFRCIVKAFGRSIDEDQGDVFRQGLARQLLRSVIKLQKLGIIETDVAIRQVIDSKLGDFSTAITLPHFITNPELNPHLSSAMIRSIKKQTFVHCINDYLAFDSMVDSWNFEYGRNRGRLSIEAFPGGRGCPRKARYNLRGGRAAERTLYTFVDPRRYRWTASRVIRGTNALLPASQRRHAGRISKVVTRQSFSSKDSQDPLRKLTARPDMWHYQCKEKDQEWADSVGSSTLELPHLLEWDCKGGYLFPVKDNGRDIK